MTDKLLTTRSASVLLADKLADVKVPIRQVGRIYNDFGKEVNKRYVTDEEAKSAISDIKNHLRVSITQAKTYIKLAEAYYNNL